MKIHCALGINYVFTSGLCGAIILPMLVQSECSKPVNEKMKMNPDTVPCHAWYMYLNGISKPKKRIRFLAWQYQLDEAMMQAWHFNVPSGFWIIWHIWPQEWWLLAIGYPFIPFQTWEFTGSHRMHRLPRVELLPGNRKKYSVFCIFMLLHAATVAVANQAHFLGLPNRTPKFCPDANNYSRNSRNSDGSEDGIVQTSRQLPMCSSWLSHASTSGTITAENSSNNNSNNSNNNNNKKKKKKQKKNKRKRRKKIEEEQEQQQPTLWE